MWNSCSLPSQLQDRFFIRTERGAAINAQERLVVSAGYVYAENGQFHR